MFVMRKAHLDAFAGCAMESFEDRMVADLGVRFPDECGELGEDSVRRHIQDGIRRAAGYEIRAECDVACFIRLMFGIRPDFDTSRKTRYAAEILQDTDRPAEERLEEIRVRARRERSSQED